MQMPVNIL